MKTISLCFHGEMIRTSDPAPDAIGYLTSKAPRGSFFISAGRGLVADLVGWFSVIRHPFFFLRYGFRIPYSHVGIVVGEDQTIEALPRGVSRGTLSGHFKNDRVVTVWENPMASGPGLDDMMAFLNSSVGMKYDWLRNLSFLVPIGADPNAFNCVELSMQAGQICGTIPQRLDPGNTTPLDMAKFFDSNRGKGYGWKRLLEWA